MASATSPTPSWVILRREASASATGDDIPQGAALSLALAAPPRVTSVKLHPTVCPAEPEPAARTKFPCILAVDPSGLLLFLTPPRPQSPDAGELRTWRGANGVERTIRVSRIPPPDYYVCDVSSPNAAAAYPVPDPDCSIFNNDLGRYMVAEFQHIVGGCNATLLCFSSDTGEWVGKKVRNPLPGWIWTFHDVLSHGGKLWWVDRVAGLLSCDPFADNPDMEFVPLPEGDVQHGHGDGCGYCSERALGSRRLVQLSGGKFRCVEMSCESHGAPKVSMRTLADPGAAEWTLEYEASFSEIWADESYNAARLPKKAPVLALVHPKDPDVVYFFLKDHLFGINMRARKVVQCEPYEDVPKAQKQGSFCSWLLLPWDLPPAFCAGPSSLSTTNGANEEPSASTSATPVAGGM